jgi:putative ABC transport system permease protein
MTGVQLTASLGMDEFGLALSGAVIGILLATVPALLLYRRSVAAFLR